jgi:hypothetical protein
MLAASRPLRAAVLAAALAACADAAAAPGTISDDYARALAEAKRRGVPLVVDVWAPW